MLSDRNHSRRRNQMKTFIKLMVVVLFVMECVNAHSEGNSVGDWYVQIGMFADQNNARDVLSDFRMKGVAGELAQVSTSGGTLSRVRVGPYADKALALAAQAQAIRDGYPQAHIVSITDEQAQATRSVEIEKAEAA